MRCKAWVHVVNPRTGKSFKDRRPRWVAHPGPLANGLMNPNQPDGTEVCGGALRVDVEAADEPYFGGHSASLEVRVVCERCGCEFHGVPSPVPTTGRELGALLTSYVADLPE